MSSRPCVAFLLLLAVAVRTQENETDSNTSDDSDETNLSNQSTTISSTPTSTVSSSTTTTTSTPSTTTTTSTTSTTSSTTTSTTTYPVVNIGSAVCALGDVCRVTLCCNANFDAEDVLYVSSDPDSCSKASSLSSQLPVSGLLGSASPDPTDNATYNLGQPVKGTVGTYSLCWQQQYPPSGIKQLEHVGHLLLVGPQVGDFTCVLSLPCSVELDGFGLNVANSLMVVQGTSCDPTFALSLPGLTNPQLPLADGANYSLGTPAAALPTNGSFALCWASSAAGDYAVFVDASFDLLGPHDQGTVECVVTVPCNISLTGVGLVDTNELLIAAACGSSATPISFAGLTNPQQPSGASSDTYSLGTGTTPVNAATYVLCWTYDAGAAAGHPVQVGSFRLVGPTTGAATTCVLGEPCVVQLQGAGFALGDALLVRAPGEGCGSPTTGVEAAWEGLSSSQLSSTADPSRYELGTGLAGNVRSGYVLCWTASGAGELPGDVAAFIVPAGSFAMEGPSVLSHPPSCFLATPCTIQIQGYGLTVSASLALRRGEGNCTADATAQVAGLTNPVSSSVSTPDQFDFGTSGASENPAVGNYSLCWGLSSFGLQAVYAGQFQILGPLRLSSLSCTLGEPCNVELSGFGLYGDTWQTSVALITGTSSCGLYTAYAAWWLFLTSVLVGPVEEAASFRAGERGLASFGTPLYGDPGRAYSLCWRYAQSTFLYEYEVTIDSAFTLKGPDGVITVTCTLGHPCELQLSGFGFDATDALAIVEHAQPCGQESTALAAVFNNPVSPESNETNYELYRLGNETSPLPGVYRLCWAQNPTNQSVQYFRVDAGTLTLVGPSGANYSCYFGLPCSLTFSGQDLSADNRLALVTDETCGLSNPNLVSFGGLPAANPMIPQQTGTLYDIGVVTSGLPQAVRLCWSSQPYDPAGDGYAAFNVEVGTLAMNGPIVDLQRDCQICKLCSIGVPGFGLTAADRIVMIEPSGTCGNEVHMTTLQLYADHAGLQNPPTFTSVQDSGLSYDVGTPTSGVPGNYSICWGHSPQTLGDYNLQIGVFQLTASDPVVDAGCSPLVPELGELATEDSAAYRASALDNSTEASSAIDNDTATGWFAASGSCSSAGGSCVWDSCSAGDPPACAVATCSTEPWLILDLKADRLICKLQIVNGLLLGSAASGVRSLVIEGGSSLQGPWSSQHTVSMLRPSCVTSPESIEAWFPEDPVSARYLRLRILESWGADSAGFLEVIVWASPWQQERGNLNPSQPFTPPALPIWVVGGRSSMQTVALPNSRTVLILGGEDQFGGLHNDVHLSLDGGVTWEVAMQAAPWTARRGHAAAVDWSSSTVALTGGLARQGGVEIPRSDVWVSYNSGRSWTRQSDRNPWRQRYEHAVTFDTSGRLYLSGGLVCPKLFGLCGPGHLDDQVTSDLWVSSNFGRSWAEITPEKGRVRWSARRAFSLVAEHAGTGRLFIVGGQGPFGINLRDVWLSEDGGSTWNPTALNASFPARAFHAAAVSPDDAAIYTLGGKDSNGSSLNDVWVSTDQGVTWTQRAPFVGKRHSFGAVVDAGGNLVILGGVPYHQGVLTATCIA